MKPNETIPVSSSMQLVGRPVAYYPNIAKFLGSVKAAIFLCQFLYWEGKQEGEWIYKTREDITEETGLSRKEQDGARRVLKKLKILEEKVKGIPPIVHYKFNWLKLDELMSNQFVQKGQHYLSQTDKLNCAKGTNPIVTETTNIEHTESFLLNSKKPEFNPSPSALKSKPKTDPKVSEILSYFQEAHLRETNLKPLIDGKVGSLTKKLLSTYPLDSIKHYIDQFFLIKDDPFIKKSGRSFGVFYSQIEKIAVTSLEKIKEEERLNKWLTTEGSYATL